MCFCKFGRHLNLIPEWFCCAILGFTNKQEGLSLLHSSQSASRCIHYGSLYGLRSVGVFCAACVTLTLAPSVYRSLSDSDHNLLASSATGIVWNI